MKKFKQFLLERIEIFPENIEQALSILEIKEIDDLYQKDKFIVGRSNPAEIAYRKLMISLHPDKSDSSREESTFDAKALNQAIDIVRKYGKENPILDRSPSAFLKKIIKTYRTSEKTNGPINGTNIIKIKLPIKTPTDLYSAAQIFGLYIVNINDFKNDKNKLEWLKKTKDKLIQNVQKEQSDKGFIIIQKLINNIKEAFEILSS